MKVRSSSGPRTERERRHVEDDVVAQQGDDAIDVVLGDASRYWLEEGAARLGRGAGRGLVVLEVESSSVAGRAAGRSRRRRPRSPARRRPPWRSSAAPRAGRGRRAGARAGAEGRRRRRGGRARARGRASGSASGSATCPLAMGVGTEVVPGRGAPDGSRRCRDRRGRRAGAALPRVDLVEADVGGDGEERGLQRRLLDQRVGAAPASQQALLVASLASKPLPSMR